METERGNVLVLNLKEWLCPIQRQLVPFRADSDVVTPSVMTRHPVALPRERKVREWSEKLYCWFWNSSLLTKSIAVTLRCCRSLSRVLVRTCGAVRRRSLLLRLVSGCKENGIKWKVMHFFRWISCGNVMNELLHPKETLCTLCLRIGMRWCNWDCEVLKSISFYRCRIMRSTLIHAQALLIAQKQLKEATKRSICTFLTWFALRFVFDDTLFFDISKRLRSCSSFSLLTFYLLSSLLRLAHIPNKACGDDKECDAGNKLAKGAKAPEKCHFSGQKYVFTTY